MPQSKKIGMTAGSWDFVHAGHVLHFEECKKHCDYLVVAMQMDPSLSRREKHKPVMSLEERFIMLNACKYVDMVVLYNSEQDLYKLDLWLPIDVRFMGEDHKSRKHHKINAKIVYTSRKHYYSSTNLRERCAVK